MNNSIKMSTIVRKELGNRLVLILIVSMEIQVRKQVKQVIYQHRIQLKMVPLAFLNQSDQQSVQLQSDPHLAVMARSLAEAETLFQMTNKQKGRLKTGIN